MTHYAFTGGCEYCDCSSFTEDDQHKYVLTEGEEQALEDALRIGRSRVINQMMTLTQCPHGCEAEETCRHGYNSIGRRARVK